MAWVIREVSFPWNAPDEEGAYRAYATDERRSRSRRSTEKEPAKRLTHFSDGLLGVQGMHWVVFLRSAWNYCKVPGRLNVRTRKGAHAR
ncbi:MAG: hypothetical protein KTR25_13000 [Myxococcales bacterium]|nr:hypothetical protein [Myxococcales bacterium]